MIVAVTGAFGGGSEVGAADPATACSTSTVLPAGSRLGLVRRAWGLQARHDRRASAASSTTAAHVIEVDAAAGTEFNADGEVRDRGLERVTVERDAYALGGADRNGAPAAAQAAGDARRRPRAGRRRRA